MIELPPLIPIGVVHSKLRTPEDAPRQGREAEIEAEVEVWPEFSAGLEGVAARERVLVVCWLHRARRDVLRVASPGDGGPERGVFATRSPQRPNPLAVYPVDLLEARGNRLRVRGIDAVDGTPVLDLKPYVRRLDG